MPAWEGIDRQKEDWKWNIHHIGMLWRYQIIDSLGEEDIAIFRDCDSHLSERESIPVYKWIESGWLAHAFYENPTHYNGGFQGGMWGIRSNKIYGVVESLENWIEFYKTCNHDWIFVDLQYNLNVLLPMFNKGDGYLMRFGYGTSNPLPELANIEDSIGWVKNENWRGQEFNPEEYIKEKNGKIQTV